MNRQQSSFLRIQRAQRTLCIVLLAVLGFSISCDRDCPTQPPPPEDKGYNFYVLLESFLPSPYRSRVYVYNTKQMAFVDSIFPTPDYTYSDIEVSADEKYLFLARRGFVQVIDVATHQPVASFTGDFTDVSVSPNGKFVALHGSYVYTQSANLYLDARTLDTIAVDTMWGYGGAFDSTGNIFYCTNWPDAYVYSVIRRYDVANRISLPEAAFWDTLHPLRAILRLQPTVDSNKLAVLLFNEAYGPDFVGLYNMFDSSLTNTLSDAEYISHLGLTPDWKTLIYTSPSTFDYPSTRYVYFAGVASGLVESMLPPPPYTNDPGVPSLNPNKSATSPDGKYTIVSSEETAWVGLISTREHKYISFLKPTNNDSYAIGVACRTQP